MRGCRRKQKALSRREVIKRAALAGGSLMIIPRRVLGGRGYIAPSDEVIKAVIGVGDMGRAHLQYPGSRLLAVCDVDSGHLPAPPAASAPGGEGTKDIP